MTLDEAILHAREVAERNRKQYKNCLSDRTDIRYQTCEECAEEHEQLAEWLEELKSYRASVFSGDMTQKMLKEEYCKAVDDFTEKIIRYVDCGHLCSPTEIRWSDLAVVEMVKKLAEEYKDGWIACSKKLPEDDSICIVTVEYPNNEIAVDYGWFDRKSVCWFVGMQEFRTSNILAWQPLPKPFKERD